MSYKSNASQVRKLYISRANSSKASFKLCSWCTKIRAPVYCHASLLLITCSVPNWHQFQQILFGVSDVIFMLRPSSIMIVCKAVNLAMKSESTWLCFFFFFFPSSDLKDLRKGLSQTFFPNLGGRQCSLVTAHGSA